MKMKLAQRIAIHYYKTKIKAVQLVAPRKAAEIAFKLFCTPYSGKPRREVPAVFHHAEKLSFELEKGQTIRGWKWQPAHPNGKKVLIAHGFDSCSYKFDNYVTLLTTHGFEVMAFDAPGHGVSDGNTINVLQYMETYRKVSEQFGPLYSIIAHSLGALAASLVAGELKGLQKLVLVAPATETASAIDNFFRFIPLGDTIQRELEQLIVEMAQQPISYFSVKRAARALTIPTLWLHDKDDSICSFDEVLPIYHDHPPHLSFHITEGLGHSRIYRNEEVMKVIKDFLLA